MSDQKTKYQQEFERFAEAGRYFGKLIAQEVSDVPDRYTLEAAITDQKIRNHLNKILKDATVFPLATLAFMHGLREVFGQKAIEQAVLQGW